MHVIILASYLTAAAAFVVATVLLAIGWRGQRSGTLLIIAMAATALWAAFLAYTEWGHSVSTNWVMLAEVLRYGAWLAFIGTLAAAWPLSGLLRGVRIAVHVLWVLLALYCVAPAAGIPQGAGFGVGVLFVGILVLALVGIVFLEQIYRNIDAEQRWAIKFLIIAAGGFFAYDIFLYSYAVLYQQINASWWAARGFFDAMLVPLLLVAAARNPEWRLNVGVSRHAVFYSTSLMVTAFYLIATAVGGYYVRLYGGDWGKVAQITLICFALLVVLVMLSSGRARSRLRVFLHKNFFSLRYDYRDEWLRLTAALSAGDDPLPLRAVKAIAQTVDSPAGVLLMPNADAELVPEASWNLSLPPEFKLPMRSAAFDFMRARRWVYDLTASPPLGDPELSAPPALAGLPRAWLLVPLLLGDRLVGGVLVAKARAPRPFDWEDIDLLRAAGSQVASVLAQATDARRLAEARQFEGFNRLTAFLMHDLKNVAAQQSLLLQNAERHKTNPAFIDDMLATVANSVRRISRLLEQLRGGARPAAQQRVGLGVVLERALVECRAQEPHPEYAAATENLWVRADAEQLATVLGHVLRNAQDAAQAHGHVALRVTRAGAEALVEVEDDGAGMDAAFIRDKLFQPFYTTKASKGMGVGAYQAREYVRSLGGSVRVQSTPGHGTVFAIHLPLAEAVEPAAETDDKLAAAP